MPLLLVVAYYCLLLIVVAYCCLLLIVVSRRPSGQKKNAAIAWMLAPAGVDSRKTAMHAGAEAVRPADK